MTDFVHYKENNDDTQSHLDANREKYETDAQFLLKQMKRGEILTAQTVVKKYSCEPRRLRDLHNDGKCEKAWKLNEAGKRLYVEYFIPPPEAPTKEKSQSYWNGFFNNILTQPKMF